MASKGVEVRVLRRQPSPNILMHSMVGPRIHRKRCVSVRVLPQAADAVFQMQCAAISKAVRNPMVSGGSSSRPHHY